MRFLHCVLLLLLPAFIAGQFNDPTYNPIQQEQERLWDARERWPNFDAYIANYSSTQTGFDDLNVRVENQVVVEVTYVNSGAPVPSDVFSKVPDVNGLFDIIQAAIDKVIQEGLDMNDAVVVEYNSKHGYPLDVNINYGPDHPENFLANLFDLIAKAETDEDRRDFESAKERWGQEALQTYNYTLTLHGFLPPSWQVPIRVIVEDGVVVDRIFDDGDPPNPPSFYTTLDAYAVPIDQHFVFIEYQIGKVYELAVVYNPWLGYPTSIFVDFSEVAFDEQLFLAIRDLESPEYQGSNEVCTFGVDCCVEDCCGDRSRWDNTAQRCVRDPNSSGFNQSEGHSSAYDPSCKQLEDWACCEEACCDDDTTSWDASTSFCVGNS